MGHSHVLPPALRTPAGAAAVVRRLLEKAGERMRHLGFCARGLSVHARAEDGRLWAAKSKLTACADTWTLMESLVSLWEHPFLSVRQVGFVLYDLLPLSGATVSLFETDTRRLDAARAVDAPNQKYGRGSVSLASMVPVQNTAEDKIAFGKIAEMWDPLLPLIVSQIKLSCRLLSWLLRLSTAARSRTTRSRPTPSLRAALSITTEPSGGRSSSGS